MKLRHKTVLIVGTTLLILLAVVYAVSAGILRRGFARAEEHEAQQVLNGSLNVLSQSIDGFNQRYAELAKSQCPLESLQQMQPEVNRR